MKPMRVNVSVTTLWVSPDRPRPVDAPAIADSPDPAAWLAALDAHAADADQGRLGLHGRVDSQLLAGEPLFVLDAAADHAGWVQVVCPWQPSERDERGYPGWVRRAHLINDDTPGHARGPENDSWALAQQDRDQPVLALARQHLGLPYLWGGLSPLGLDCSGLVHLVHRELGVVVPRDAHDQQAACIPIALDQVQAGDLYFFARDGKPAHHVGIVTEPGSMIHAPETGQGIAEEPLDPDRLATLSGAGRLPQARA